MFEVINLKKKITFIILFVFIITFTQIKAVTYHEYLPGGKNYLDIENIEVNGNTLYTTNGIRVLPNQYYTLSLPDETLLGQPISILVEGDDVYIDEVVYNECSNQDGMIVCTFLTSNTESYIHIAIQSNDVEMYYNYYNIENFQLEEGQYNTSYETYIPPYIDSTSPEFNGSGAYIVSYDSNITITEIIQNHIRAYDEIDGDISDQIAVVTDSYTPNKLIIGEYLVELSVKDSSNNEAFFDLYVFVKDEIAPYISGPNTISLNVDEQLELNHILSTYYSYHDDYDVDPQIEIIDDGYTQNNAILGNYSVTLKLVDQSFNSVQMSIVLVVEDITKPQLNSNTHIITDVNQPVSLNEIIDSLDVSDNYDSTVIVNVVSDSYSSNESTVGTYFVDLELKDSSDNTKMVTLFIEVEDTEPPQISGSNSFSFSYKNSVSLEDIKSYLQVSDNASVLSLADLFVIDDTYTNRTSETGSYYVLFGLKDDTGNQSQFRIDIDVYDDEAPYIFIDQYIVIVDLNSSFDTSDVMKLLSLNNVIDDEEEVTFHVLKDDYIGNEDIPGEYIYEVEITKETGETITKEFLITVEEENVSFHYTRQVIIGTFSLLIIIGMFIIKKK